MKRKMLEHIVQQMETEREVDRSAAIADMRFDFIERLCEQTVVKPKESKERIRSEKIDRILTGKYTAIPCFIGIMVLVFYLTFQCDRCMACRDCWRWELISCLILWMRRLTADRCQ